MSKEHGLPWYACRKLLHIIYNSFILVFRTKHMPPHTLLIMSYSLYGGGAERVASILANGLSNHYIVTVLNFEKKGKTYELFHDVNTFVAREHFIGSLKTVERFFRIYLSREKRAGRIDAAISLMYGMNRLNVKTKGTERTICSERNNPAKKEPEHMEELERLYEHADHVVFQSAVVQNLL